MSLRPHRISVKEDISFFMNETAEAGGIVCHNGTASGQAMDNASATVTYVATALSGVKPVGLLLNKVVNLDLTRQKLNAHKDEVQLGSKVTLAEIGTYTTNHIYPGQTPTPGQYAYVAHSGYISNVDIATDHSNNSRLVGRFISGKDEDGYAKVSINLPNQ